MNWILLGFITLLAQKQDFASIYGMASPLPVPIGVNPTINPYIRHWEPANFNRYTLDEAHQNHVRQQSQRRKRELNPSDYGPANTIKLNFFAHDREFRLVLRQDPASVFASDVEMENTLGPIDYDISRIYTGSLEDDDNSHVHAILTSDNLLDGTISTNSDQFYIEPSQRYSKELHNAGIHSVVYKLSDVSLERSVSPTLMVAINSHEHCASEKLRKKMKNTEFKKKRKPEDKYAVESSSRSSSSHTSRRQKRWLPEEVSNSQNPPLPLDLDEPYNARGFNGAFSRNNNANSNNYNSQSNQRSPYTNDDSSVRWNPTSPNNRYKKPEGNYRLTIGTGRADYGFDNRGFDISGSSDESGSFVKPTRNRNIIVNDYNPNSDFNIRNHFSNRNILVNSFNNSITKFNGDNFLNNNTYYTSGSVRSSSGSSTSRPSHKTHVEIITKNGATKRPHIIVNNYNPDVILTSQNYNSHLNLNVRNDLSDLGASSKSSYDKKSACMLYLQADHTFFQKMGSDEASIEAITRHVQRANAIYKITDFNGDGKPDNITFMIKRIKVHNMNALKDPTYRFPGNYGVEKFLELFSEEDYDAFCLAYMFTYRDFEMGTLGLAWTGDLKNAGGVCEKNGHYRGSLKSLNTGIVTLLNYGKHVPPAVSHVTLAHEIGHNFGSPHDPEQCTPGGEDGNYIMFARATSGDKRNNNKFSPCSLKSIEPVLNAKARSAKGCFTEPQQSICGNGVVEPGEQCDCGWEEDCKDSCCFPMSRHPRIDEKPCTLTPRAMCSPSQGPCCTTDCSLKFGDKCRDDNGCRDPSFCDGRMPQCPPSVNKANKTICNKEFVCYMGECTGSICLAYGLESCQCLPGPNDPKTKSCELCCKLPGESNPCKSSFEWNEAPFDVPDMYAKPGTPCNDYNGYCDVFQKCREVDPSGPLATLRKLLLSEESIASFKKWFIGNWYTVALAFVGVILLLVLSTKLLGKRSNLKLKSVTIIHSATTETVRLPEDNNGVIVHTAIRKKVPFKKKVRGDRSKAAKGSTKKISAQPVANASGTVVTSNSKGTNVVVKKISKRNTFMGSETPKKLTRKKNRVSAATGAEDQQNPVNEVKKSKKSKKPKEVIDYSSNTENHTNTFGKVQKWLLESPIVSQPLSQIEHSSKVRKIISKSQSTPERLVQKSPTKTKSVGNLSNDKVKLQVVYKPPFKFSLKLSKNSAVKTHIIGGALSRSKRKSRSDKKRAPLIPGQSGSSRPTDRGKRAALLVKSTEDDTCNTHEEATEPNYETLNPKSKDNPFYENFNLCETGNNLETHPIASSESKSANSATFRIKRSASNNNLVPHNAQSMNSNSVYSRSNSLTNSTRNGINKSTNAYKNLDSSTNISRNFGSTQNLIPSNSGSLTKSSKRNSLNLKHPSAFESGLSNNKRHGSNMNLRRENSNSNLRLSNEMIHSKGNNLSRNSSSTNLKCTSLSRGSANNVPRANLSNAPPIPTPAFTRQTSLQMKPVPQISTSYNEINPSNNLNNVHNINSSNINKNIIKDGSNSNPSSNKRPHTAACDDMKQFVWPKVLPSNSKDKTKHTVSSRNEDPLPSDHEVMVSDIENLVS